MGKKEKGAEAIKGSARHVETKAEPLGLGAEAAAAPGRQAKSDLWDLSIAVPKWAPRALSEQAKKFASPAVAASLELEGAKALRSLRKDLEALCKERGLSNIRPLTLERWRWAAKWEEEEATKAQAVKKANLHFHPVMPSKPAPKADAELVLELQRQGVSADAAASCVAALRKSAATLAGKLLKQAHALASGGKPPPAPPLKLTFNRHNIDISCGKTQLKLSLGGYGKLAILHRRSMPSSEAAPEPDDDAAVTEHGSQEAVEAAAARSAAAKAVLEGDESGGASAGGRLALHQRMLALLLRYRSLQGDGFQAAIGKPVWECLQAKLGVACECFASPLNAYLPTFGSGFADVDGPFGSRGSFFGFRPLSGSFAANPPFVHPIMDAMAEHILELLTASSAADGGNHPLSFTVIIPGWTESVCYQKLLATPFLRKHVLIAAADHGYCDGASYARQDPFRHSPFDTAVLVLQTDKASRKWSAEAGFEAALRAAFAACVPSAAAVARQAKRDAGARPRGEGGGAGSGKKRGRDGGTDGRKGKKRRSDSDERPKYDKETEKRLNEWVQAKRKGDYVKSDAIRSELAAKGVDADAARPARQKVAAEKKRADESGEAA